MAMKIISIWQQFKRGRALSEIFYCMRIITTEHRLRCDAYNSCWVLLVRQTKWSVASVELPDGTTEFVSPVESFDTEEEALNHARTWVCAFSGQQYQ
jgi:hypothetical protein